MKTTEIIREAAGILYEMSNLDTSITGVVPTIYCGPEGNSKHECRVKVSNIPGKMASEDTFSVELKDLSIHGHCKLSADDLEAVKWWIHKNRFVILDYWKNRINTRQFVNSVKSIEEKE